MPYTLATGWGELSPEAQKAAEHSQAMSNIWDSRLSCRLSRTNDKAILQWPDYGGRRHRGIVRRWITKELPVFQFNDKRNWFEAPLDQLSAAAALLPEYNVSQGVREYLGDTQS